LANAAIAASRVGSPQTRTYEFFLDVGATNLD
jgi:hypothetical protein